MSAHQSTVFAVVLAAGRASRFGTTKQAAELRGISLVQRAMDIASTVCASRVLTVLGHDWARVFEASACTGGFMLMNDAYEAGIGTSIRAAARTCGEHADAMLILLADQPLITAGHLQTLIDAWSGDKNHIVATAFNNGRGAPALLPAGVFADLELLGRDTGASELFDDARFRLTTVTFEAAAVDIDTPADLAALT